MRCGWISADIPASELPFPEVFTRPAMHRAGTVSVPRAAFDGLVKVAVHVSLGRGAVDLAPFPDVVARRALGALDEAGLLERRGDDA